eukprot:1141329-Alexandrium_andersonii.AAC.1
MSASLVGSEMCIRDSSSTMQLQLPRESGAGWQHKQGIASHRALNRNGRTVSYTHLTLPTICSV